MLVFGLAAMVSPVVHAVEDAHELGSISVQVEFALNSGTNTPVPDPHAHEECLECIVFSAPAYPGSEAASLHPAPGAALVALLPGMGGGKLLPDSLYEARGPPVG